MSLRLEERDPLQPARTPSKLPAVTFLAVVGPGLVVMLADTDVGSIVTAAQSGIQWGYSLVLLQLALIPVLYIVQELTVRLGIFTGKGHGELIRDTFGKPWAWVSAIGLGVAAFGALLTEFTGIVGLCNLYGISPALGLVASAGFLIAVVMTGTYRRVERIAIALGLFEFAFFFVALRAHPNGSQILHGLGTMPLGNRNYLFLAVANIGAVIMPWMIFYQQSAIADKKLKAAHYKYAKRDTALGAVVTQLVMIAVLIAVAATLGRSHHHQSLDSVEEISNALVPFLGSEVGRMVFALGTLGAALVATIVVSLAAAWGFGEVSGYKRSLECHPKDAPWFYGIFCAAIIVGAVVVGVTPNQVALNLGVELMNALMLPLVLFFLVALALRALPSNVRLKGTYAWVVISVSALTSILCVYGGIASLIP